MSVRDQWVALGRVPAVRSLLCGLGCLLLLITPFLGVLPGPGGMVTFAAGAALVLRYSRWGKRLYARLGRRWPKAGEWGDWALRRPSYQRRQELRRHRNEALACD
ncbi:MAG TPA: hypothetical protein VF631_00795 [Allosphingosinicella sp.]|jgi:hypothetical protein|uniref:hypothetical protein n=1 Tax=Allosphingosinicella sp. TaxID=2823234 RepID=UPI002F297290